MAELSLMDPMAIPAPPEALSAPDPGATLVRHASLVAEYTSYMLAAGYATSPRTMAQRSLGAWSFLSRFPQPEAWLELPLVDQMRLPPRERSFVHYLFLRHALPLPPAYALLAGAHLGDMARRLMEQETYECYQRAALHLGYTDATIRRQFQSLLCLMAWARKPFPDIAVDDLDAFVHVLRVAYQEAREREDIQVLTQNGLPRSYTQQLVGLRHVLSQLGILPQPPVRRRGKQGQPRPAQPTPAQRRRLLRQDGSSPQACLVAEYTSYMAAAGYSTTPGAITERSMAAWAFLSRFPRPEAWLDLPLEAQVHLRPEERTFLHYLFLRHLLPMPPGYILVSGHRLGDLVRRLMERDTFQRYRETALGLGYAEPAIRRQFEALLSLMAWAQKPMAALSGSDLGAFAEALRTARQALEDRGGFLSPQDMRLGMPLPRIATRPARDGLPRYWEGQLQAVRQVLYHQGILYRPDPPRRWGQSFSQRWQGIPTGIAATVQRYLGQLSVSLRPNSLVKDEARLRRFFLWLAQAMPEVTAVNQLQRCHLEAFKEYLRWVPPHPKFRRPERATLSTSTIAAILCSLNHFFCRTAQWGWPEAPSRPLLFAGDLPHIDWPLPRFLEEPEAARFLQAASAHPDLFTRVCGVTLLRTGLRKGEFLDLTMDCMVPIGESYWLRVPLGKSHQDRFVPLHPQVKHLLEEWTSKRGPHGAPLHPHDFLFVSYGRRIGRGKVDLAVHRIAAAAGIAGRVTPHRLRHTLATLAINHGMPLESIAALLGHRSLSMTLRYARIGQRTLNEQYTAAIQSMEHRGEGSPGLGPVATSGQLPQLAAADKGASPRPNFPLPPEAPEDYWRLLGNGYCTRPPGVPCEYEFICESCLCFKTTPDFLPHLSHQKEDAEAKGNSQKANVLDKLIRTVEVLP